MSRVLSGFILIIAIACSSQPYAKPSATIVVVGDSLSAAYGIDQQQGWVFLLQQHLQQQQSSYQVVNASISGDTTRNGLNRLSSLLDRHQPAIVILELGGNDGLRGLSLGEIRHNLSRMIELCQERNARVLLTGVQIPPNYGARYTDAFHAIYHELAKQHGVALVPSLLQGVGGNAELMQMDGIHPTAEAQNIMLHNVLAQLQTLLSQGQAGKPRLQNN